MLEIDPKAMEEFACDLAAAEQRCFSGLDGGWKDVGRMRSLA